MTLRRLSLLQWAGLFGGAGIWAIQHIVGFGVTQARCGAGGVHWGIDQDLFQELLLAVTALIVICAGAAAATVVFGTRETSYESAPPSGRVRFFALAALAANVLFLTIILLDGIASTLDETCRQS